MFAIAVLFFVVLTSALYHHFLPLNERETANDYRESLPGLLNEAVLPYQVILTT